MSEPVLRFALKHCTRTSNKGDIGLLKTKLAALFRKTLNDRKWTVSNASVQLHISRYAIRNILEERVALEMYFRGLSRMGYSIDIIIAAYKDESHSIDEL